MERLIVFLHLAALWVRADVILFPGPGYFLRHEPVLFWAVVGVLLLVLIGITLSLLRRMKNKKEKENEL